MKTINKILLLFISGFIISCQQHSGNYSLGSEEVIEKYRNGDVEAFYTLQRFYHMECVPGLFIDDAKYFADTIKYKPAYLDVFEEYLFKYGIDENYIEMPKMSEIDRKDAIKYLNKAREYKVEGIENYTNAQ